MNQYCTRYLQFLSLEKNASPNTVASYRLDITRYLRFLESQNIRNIDGVSGANTAQFLVTLHEQGLSPRSVNRCFSAIKGFHKFLVGDGICRSNPTDVITPPKLGRALPGVLTQEEVEAILSQPKEGARDLRARWIRDKAILEVLYATGMSWQIAESSGSLARVPKSGLCRSGNPPSAGSHGTRRNAVCF
jgi:integrase/recombinase XerD